MIAMLRDIQDLTEHEFVLEARELVDALRFESVSVEKAAVDRKKGRLVLLVASANCLETVCQKVQEIIDRESLKLDLSDVELCTDPDVFKLDRKYLPGGYGVLAKQLKRLRG